ncbi:MAG: M15 family metallopeptidase [Eubacterium sp.]|nr:M15 family metallopeptidase [Eubacterium sp.]
MTGIAILAALIISTSGCQFGDGEPLFEVTTGELAYEDTEAEIEVTTEETTEATTEVTTETTEKPTEATTEATTEEITEEATEETTEEAVEDGDWCLILVNKDNPVPEDYEVKLTDLTNGNQVDSRIYPKLQEMFDDARSYGMDLFVREGYRTREDQQSIMDNRVEAYEAEGYSEEEAIEFAKQYVAEPGTSEHELGISVDINANNDVSDDDTIYTWLDENAYKYGFIKRYPENKIDITGINNEPWHYRYVGLKAAQEMKDMDLCLEEYLDYLSENE